MSFWSLAAPVPGSPALIHAGPDGAITEVSYADLTRNVDACAQQLGRSTAKRLGVIVCRNVPEVVYAYLAALRSGDAVLLLNPATAPEHLRTILDGYQPNWLFQPHTSADHADYQPDPGKGDWAILRRKNPSSETTIHPDLAVLLSTSGTTGSPKMVRLSHTNIASNATAIAEYLTIEPGVRVITTLPFNYSYGMSVINSHLAAGATIVLTESSLLTPDFWNVFQGAKVNSLPGVPYTYQMLHRLNPKKLPLENLRVLTQAGGRLAPALVRYFHALSAEKDWRFFVMYGQTEAAPRMSYLPHDAPETKWDSIGVAIPGGRLSLSADNELIYEGPNVMMGYAHTRQDLSRDDEQAGRLATGDLARVDADGFFYLQGRLKRFIKIHGNRIGMDDIEQHVESVSGRPAAVTGEDDKLMVLLTAGTDIQPIKEALTRTYHLHPTTFTIRHLESIPYTSSGKKDYAQLKP